MRVCVLGGGIIGVTTAWALAEAVVLVVPSAVPPVAKTVSSAVFSTPSSA